MKYTNQALKEIVFPLGGIGTGCLVEWAAAGSAFPSIDRGKTDRDLFRGGRLV